MSIDSTPLRFAIDRPGSWQTPFSKYWIAGLPDGREVSFHADSVAVNSAGALTAWADDKDSNITVRRELLLSIPAGSWTHVYAASVLDGSPICVEELAAPDTTGATQQNQP